MVLERLEVRMLMSSDKGVKTSSPRGKGFLSKDHPGRLVGP